MPEDVNNDQQPEEVEDNTQEPRPAVEGDLGETEPMPPRGDMAWLGVDGTAAGALIRVVDTGPTDGYFDPETTAWYETLIRTPRDIDVDASIPMLKKMHEKTLFEESAAKGYSADRFIMIGEALIQIKKKVARKHGSFKVWASKNLDFMGKRLIQQAIQLAKVNCITEYTHLGKKRLVGLVSASKDFDEHDPIGAFLEVYHIPFNPTVEQETKEYLEEVDKACAHHRFCKDLAKAELPTRDVSFDLFKRLVAAKGKPGAKLIQEVKLAHENGQPVGEYLESLIRGKGAYDEAAKSATKAESFKDGVKGLKEKAKWASENFVEVKDTIDDDLVADLDLLKAKLVELIERKKALEQTEAA